MERANVEAALLRQPSVALLGPRQVGKTTLARAIADSHAGLYLDVTSPYDRARLSDVHNVFSRYQDKLVAIDEIHCLPDLFVPLRGTIDEGRRNGHRYGRFLLLGSAFVDLLRQSGEALAGRVEFCELTPLHALELENEQSDGVDALWLRGGFPESFLARSDAESFRIRRNLVTTYLARETGEFHLRLPTQTIERLWAMLAHYQGALLNTSQIATNLQVFSKSLTRYIDILDALFLIRRLRPYAGNSLKRLTRSPKTYIRDCGMLHVLLEVTSMYDLLGSPVVGGSWEGFVIETLLAVAPEHVRPSFYRTAAGAEMDPLLESGGSTGTWAIEIKRSAASRSTRGFHSAIADIRPAKAFVVHGGKDRFRLGPDVESIGFIELAHEIRELIKRLAASQRREVQLQIRIRR